MSRVSQDRAENRLLVRVGKPKQNGPAAFGCDRRGRTNSVATKQLYVVLRYLNGDYVSLPILRNGPRDCFAGGMGFVKGCNRRLRAKEGVSRLREYPTSGRMLV